MLSHRFKLPNNARYVGILSRFDLRYRKKDLATFKKNELVVVLSGPEPQLSIINELVIRQALAIPNKTLVISGLKENPKPSPDIGHLKLTLVSHLEPGQFGHAMLHADLIVCRSGYSGIMDLVTLRRTAILIPTPGQSEQKYLACYLSHKGWFFCINQHELDLGNLIKNKETISSSCHRFNFIDREELPIDPLSGDKHDYHGKKSHQKA